MTKLNNKLMNLAQDENNKIFEVISEIKEKLLKMYNSDIVRPKDKNMVLKKYSAFDELGKYAYKYFKLKDNDLYDDAQKEFDNISNLVLKGGVSNTVFIWHSEFDEHTCEDCASLDGTQYTLEDDIPDSPHPNCKCYIEIVEFDGEEDGEGDGNSEHTTKSRPNKNKNDEPCDCRYDLLNWLNECEYICEEYNSAEDTNTETINELNEIINNVSSCEIENIEFNIMKFMTLKYDTLKELTSILIQVIESIEIFKSNYDKLISLKEELGYYLDYSAEYYHTKANCEAAQLGDVGEKMATLLGYLREILDFHKEILFKGYSIEQAFENSVHDLEVNEAGRKLGRENRDKKPEDIIDKPNGLPEKYWW